MNGIEWTRILPCGECGQQRYSETREPEVEPLRGLTEMVRGPRSAGRLLMPAFERENGAPLRQERIVALYLDGAAGRLAGPEVVAIGGLDECQFDRRVILGRALRLGAVGIIIAHNHPSGVLMASRMDVRLTEELRRAAGIVEIDIVDHLIVASDRRVYSMRTEKCYQIESNQQDAATQAIAADAANGVTREWSEG